MNGLILLGQYFGGGKICYFEEKVKIWIGGGLKVLYSFRGEYIRQ